MRKKCIKFTLKDVAKVPQKKKTKLLMNFASNSTHEEEVLKEMNDKSHWNKILILKIEIFIFIFFYLQP